MSKHIDFIGIGAAKSGTTWLADNLRKHPELFIPKEKELSYFNPQMGNIDPKAPNPNHAKPLNWYHRFFRNAHERQLRGEISVAYMLKEETAKNIFLYNPLIKLIVMLRDPVQQSYSLYLSHKQRGVCNYSSFREAIEKKPEVYKNSFFYRQLIPYFKLFPRQQIKILFYQDMVKDPQGFLDETSRFLGVSTQAIAPGERSNATSGTRVSKLNYFMHSFRRTIDRYKLNSLLVIFRYTGILRLGNWIMHTANKKSNYAKPELENDLKNELQRYYQRDIEQLENLTKRDLTNWKTTEADI